MIAKLLLDKKREGHALGSAEIREFIEGFTRGEIPDYQMSAMAMAICCRGMTDRETNDLTEAMTKSGQCLSWEETTADKHSTGGVGDKLSLVIQPLAAACGVCVPSLSGRGLGITGGTADKLETIPGFRAALSLDEFKRTVREAKVSIATQTEEIAPADRKLYALRDVTGTIPSIPLIVGSILSKKLAEGAGSLVFDVKCGSGAFMKTREDAVALANALVKGAKAAGRKSAALVTDMNAPLGRAIGNVNEVQEALDMLTGRIDECTKPLVELSVELAALMVSLAREIPLDEARNLCQIRLNDGSAFTCFANMVKAQGGDLEKFANEKAKPTFKFKIQAMRSGYVNAIDAEKVGRVALSLGAGRFTATDRIDPLAGVTLAVRLGDRVSLGEPLATLEKSFNPDDLERAAADLYRAFDISCEPTTRPNLILEHIS